MFFKKEKEYQKSGKNVYLLLDRSSSMSPEWGKTIESVNGYIRKLEDDVNVYVAVFDCDFNGRIDYQVIRETNAKSYIPLTESYPQPRGSTPLYDATGKIISKMISDNPERAVLVIVTDGEENSSCEYTLSSVRSKLAEIERKNWPVVYLGANFKEVETYIGSTYNASRSSIINTTNLNRGAVMSNLSAKTGSYFSSTLPDADIMGYSEEEKENLSKVNSNQ